MINLDGLVSTPGTEFRMERNNHLTILPAPDLEEYDARTPLTAWS